MDNWSAKSALRKARAVAGAEGSVTEPKLLLVPDRPGRATSSRVSLVARVIDLAVLLAIAVVAGPDLAAAVAIVVGGSWAAWSTGLTSGRLAPRVSDEIPDLVLRVSLAVVAVGFIGGSGVGLGDVVRLGLVILVAIVVARAGFYWLMRKVRSEGYALEPAIVVGAGSVGVDLATAFGEHPEIGLIPAGFVDHVEPANTVFPYLGAVGDLAAIMNRVGARHAIFAFGRVRESEMISTIRRSRPGSHFYVLVRFFELGVDPGPATRRADIAGYPVLQVRAPAPGHPMLKAKRIFDFVAASLGVIILSPLMAICALAVRLSSPGPILFRQLRVGRDGQEFEIMKFRTMTVNEDSDTTWSVETDNRITAVGSVLRASHLDEMPQLFNVIRGEMSLVGPRPERPFFVEQFADEVHGYGDRHRVKSGITGWSQVNGLVGDSSIEERARRDNWYIENWSLWSDLMIMLRTIPTMSKRDN